MAKAIDPKVGNTLLRVKHWRIKNDTLAVYVSDPRVLPVLAKHEKYSKLEQFHSSRVLDRNQIKKTKLKSLIHQLQINKTNLKHLEFSSGIWGENDIRRKSVEASKMHIIKSMWWMRQKNSIFSLLSA